MDYKEKIKNIPKERLVFIDESGCDNRETPKRGWSVGRLWGFVSGKKSKRVSVISAVCNGQKLSPYMFEGTCRSDIFEAYVRTVLLEEIQPNQVVVMDNATFHKRKSTLELFEKAGITVIFLPPYSPDLNPQETVWANMKNYIRKYLNYFDRNLPMAILAFFKKLS